MKLFISVRENFSSIGIDASQRQFNGRVQFFFIAFIITLCSSFIYLINDVNTFKEYTDTIYMISSTAVIGFIYAVVVVKVTEAYIVLDKLGKVFNERKYYD